MPMEARDIETMIKEAIPDAKVEIRDLAGDGDHYAATVTSAAFKGKSRVQQHQMVLSGPAGTHGRCPACPGADHHPRRLTTHPTRVRRLERRSTGVSHERAPDHRQRSQDQRRGSVS